MRILFICGCLEPGRDGVGDYTRRLSGNLVSEGHEVMLLALNDPFVKNELTCESVSDKLTVVRIPHGTRMSASLRLTSPMIGKFDPEWISIQFVIFAFDNKGLPFGIGDFFSRLCRKAKIQIMFHELWLGMEKTAELKYRIWGLLQKRIVSAMLKKLMPSLIHTHSDWYLTRLKDLGCDVRKLPLFSNIPLPENFSRTESFTGLREFKGNEIIFIIFGHISTGAPLEDFMPELIRVAEDQHIRMKLVLCGNNHSERERWLKAWKDAGFETREHGQLQSAEISELLKSATIGLATTPLAVIEKSGSFMALLEHGLPVLSVAEKKVLDRPYPFHLPEGLMVYEKGNLKNLLWQVDTPAAREKLRETTMLFLNDLNKAQNNKRNS